MKTSTAVGPHAPCVTLSGQAPWEMGPRIWKEVKRPCPRRGLADSSQEPLVDTATSGSQGAANTEKPRAALGQRHCQQELILPENIDSGHPGDPKTMTCSLLFLLSTPQIRKLQGPQVIASNLGSEATSHMMPAVPMGTGSRDGLIDKDSEKVDCSLLLLWPPHSGFFCSSGTKVPVMKRAASASTLPRPGTAFSLAVSC